MSQPRAVGPGVARPPASWGATAATTLVLVRHGVTHHTSAKRFSGGLGGDNPPLSQEGRDQVAATADWLAAQGHDPVAVVASPVRRTRESADLVADRLGLAVSEEPGFAEMEFGAWDGQTFSEVAEQHGEDFRAWLGDTSVAPPGGESIQQVRERVHAGLDRVLAEHAGRTVVVVSHVTPIKALVAGALEAPLEAAYRMALEPASVSVLNYFTDDEGAVRGALRMFNAGPHRA
ncbi:histidine phosphatase family protein [Nocardioides panacisoli]|uniref:histidine phosphatase family protein n=1 Tax=Nocardioides panacisoli TaxID=627624 RepID=UPI001C627683|nr:histidine phosphatase family protein [Nocardioides panacisoli]QYJ05461.1 histidine phosphatase family protein [Nocardioides panacisoli]